MIIIVDNKSLGYEFGLDYREGDAIQSLIDLFIEKYPVDYYNKASLIIVRNEVCYFIIKNIFGELKGSLLSVEHIINKTLSNQS